MGGKRYFCDYCDRTLPCNVEARKKHNMGHQHRAAKHEYFSRLKSAQDLYNEEIQKTKCKRFISGQPCAFGERCVFSHKTMPELEMMRVEAESELKKETLPSQLQGGNEPCIDDIKRVLEAKSNPALKRIEETLKRQSKPRPGFETYSPLPPSLQPIRIHDLLTPNNYNTWG